jgi:hypothetical protein
MKSPHPNHILNVDLGCGQLAYLTQIILKHHNNCIALELNEQAATSAASTIKQSSLSHSDWEVVHMDAANLTTQFFTRRRAGNKINKIRFFQEIIGPIASSEGLPLLAHSLHTSLNSEFEIEITPHRATTAITPIHIDSKHLPRGQLLAPNPQMLLTKRLNINDTRVTSTDHLLETYDFNAFPIPLIQHKESVLTCNRSSTINALACYILIDFGKDYSGRNPPTSSIATGPQEPTGLGPSFTSHPGDTMYANNWHNPVVFLRNPMIVHPSDTIIISSTADASTKAPSYTIKVTFPTKQGSPSETIHIDYASLYPTFHQFQSDTDTQDTTPSATLTLERNYNLPQYLKLHDTPSSTPTPPSTTQPHHVQAQTPHTHNTIVTHTVPQTLAFPTPPPHQTPTPRKPPRSTRTLSTLIAFNISDTPRPGTGIAICTERIIPPQTTTTHVLLRPHSYQHPTRGWHETRLGTHNWDTLPTLPQNIVTFTTTSTTLAHGDTTYEINAAQWHIIGTSLQKATRGQRLKTHTLEDHNPDTSETTEDLEDGNTRIHTGSLRTKDTKDLPTFEAYVWHRPSAPHSSTVHTRSSAHRTGPSSEGLAEGRFWGDEPNRGQLFNGQTDPHTSVEIRTATQLPEHISGIPTTRRGLFSRTVIPAKTIITTYAGVGTHLPKDISHISPETSSHYKTLMKLNTLYVVDGFREPHLGFGLAQFCNAGNCPSLVNAVLKGSQCEAADIGSHQKSTLGLYLIALRDITANEEILINYDRHYWLRYDDHSSGNHQPRPSQLNTDAMPQQTHHNIMRHKRPNPVPIQLHKTPTKRHRITDIRTLPPQDTAATHTDTSLGDSRQLPPALDLQPVRAHLHSPPDSPDTEQNQPRDQHSDIPICRGGARTRRGKGTTKRILNIFDKMVHAPHSSTPNDNRLERILQSIGDFNLTHTLGNKPTLLLCPSWEKSARKYLHLTRTLNTHPTLVRYDEIWHSDTPPWGPIGALTGSTSDFLQDNNTWFNALTGSESTHTQELILINVLQAMTRSKKARAAGITTLPASLITTLFHTYTPGTTIHTNIIASSIIHYPDLHTPNYHLVTKSTIPIKEPHTIHLLIIETQNALPIDVTKLTNSIKHSSPQSTIHCTRNYKSRHTTISHPPPNIFRMPTLSFFLHQPKLTIPSKNPSKLETHNRIAGALGFLPHQMKKILKEHGHDTYPDSFTLHTQHTISNILRSAVLESFTAYEHYKKRKRFGL